MRQFVRVCPDGRVRHLGERAEGRPRAAAAAAAAAARQAAGADGEAALHAQRAAPAATRSRRGRHRQRRPDLGKLRRRTPTFIRASIVDPNADVDEGLQRRRHAPELRRPAVRGGARRTREVPSGGAGMTLTHRLLAPGWYRAFLGMALGFALGMGIVVAVRALYGWDPIVDWDAIITVGALIAAPPLRLPRRDRLLRLLVPLGLGRPHDPRGPLRPRRPQLARLLPREHRSQGDRHPVHLHDLLLLHRRAA